MKVLFLGYDDSRLLRFLSERCDVMQTMEPLPLAEIEAFGPSMIVSYGYTHIIKKDVVDAYDGRIVNLHISYLPWNRGVFPNVWSVIDDTPKGVTIHLVDEGVDTGDILFQREVGIDDADTLSSSYFKLRDAIEDLFEDSWDRISERSFSRVKQAHEGTFHLKKKSEELFRKLGMLNDWEITVGELRKRSSALN